MRRDPMRGVVLMLSLILLILLLNRCSGWWDDTFGPTSTGPRSAQAVGLPHWG